MTSVRFGSYGTILAAIFTMKHIRVVDDDRSVLQVPTRPRVDYDVEPWWMSSAYLLKAFEPAELREQVGLPTDRARAGVNDAE